MNSFSCIPPPFPLARKASGNDNEMMNNDCLNENKLPLENHLEDARQPKKSKNREGDFDDSRTSDNSDTEADNMSDVVSDTEKLPVGERLILALSCKDEGTRLLKSANVEGARSMYREGLQKLKDIESATSLDDNELDASQKTDIKATKVALNLNLSLCNIKLGEWSDAIQAANAALLIDDSNLKGLFRRGVARSRLGLLEESRSDLLRTCQLDPTNVEARRELELVKQKDAEARAKDRKAYGGLFEKTTGLYDDREKAMQKQKEKEKEQQKQDMEEFEKKNKELESEGKKTFESFDSWKKAKEEKKKEEAEKLDKSNRTSSKKSTTENKPDFDLDEEDKKILAETKKMGYCYFNRPVDEQEKERLAARNRPVKLNNCDEAGIHQMSNEPEKQRSLSTWNNAGTTYEEKDCSSWVSTQLKKSLGKIYYNHTPDTSPENLKNAISSVAESLTASQKGPSDLFNIAKDLLPYTIKVSSVDTIEGEAQVVVLRASKRYLYDFKICLTWDVSIPNMDHTLPPINYKGHIELSDVSSASTSQISKASINGKDSVLIVDWLAEAKVTHTSSVDPTHKPILNRALDALKEEIYRSVKNVELEFKAYS